MRDLQGAWNFRDVADTTGVLRPGRLFRSGELSELGDEGRDELRRLGVTDVADLRSRSEVLRHGPGLVPDGVDIHLLPIPDLAPDEVNPDGEAPHEHAFKRLLEDKPDDEPVSEAATRYMVDEYSRFPTYPGAQQALHRVVSLLADGRTVLAHCFAGKDRTGFTVALVLEAAGVDRDAIVADFLRSNQAVPHLRERILNAIRERSDVDMTPELMSITEARLSEEVLGVRAEYLDAARRTIDDNFGSLDGYFRSAGITEADVTRLRDALLGLGQHQHIGAIPPATPRYSERGRMRYHRGVDIDPHVKLQTHPSSSDCEAAEACGVVDMWSGNINFRQRKPVYFLDTEA